MPVWDLNAVTRPSVDSFEGLRSNFDLVVPLKSKLDALHDFISQNAANLHGLVGNVISDVQDDIIREEHQSLEDLKAFINRCLDVIQFLQIINENGTLTSV